MERWKEWVIYGTIGAALAVAIVTGTAFLAEYIPVASAYITKEIL